MLAWTDSGHEQKSAIVPSMWQLKPLAARQIFRDDEVREASSKSLPERQLNSESRIAPRNRPYHILLTVIDTFLQEVQFGCPLTAFVFVSYKPFPSSSNGSWYNHQLAGDTTSNAYGSSTKLGQNPKYSKPVWSSLNSVFLTAEAVGVCQCLQ